MWKHRTEEQEAVPTFADFMIAFVICALAVLVTSWMLPDVPDVNGATIAGLKGAAKFQATREVGE